MFEQKFRALKPVRQPLFDGLLDNAGSRKPDEGFRLSQDDVTQHGHARGDAPERRVRQERNEGHAGFMKPRHSCRRPGHLHEREDALLHSRPTRRSHE